MKNTEDLINELSTDLKAVELQKTPAKFGLIFFSITLLIIMIGLALSSLRNNFNLVFFNHLFMLEIISTLGLLFSGLIIIAWLTSPGRRFGKLYKILTSTAFLFLLILNSYRLSISPMPSSISHADSNCFFVAVFFSLLIASLLFYSVKKRVVINSVIIGMLVGFTSVAGGLLAITLHCPSTDLVHISLYHYFLPMSIGFVAGSLGGKYYLRW